MFPIIVLIGMALVAGIL